MTPDTRHRRARAAVLDISPELHQGLENLRAHKLRSLLTMLGMIFGVAAVVSMLSIGAGAQQEVMAFIEQLGVHNIIVEAREAADRQALQTRPASCRRGCRSRTSASIGANVPGVLRVSRASGSRRPSCCRKPQGEMPMVYGVAPAYPGDRGLSVVRAGSSTAGTTRRRRRCACSARPQRPALRRRRARRRVREGERAVVPRDRRAGAAAGRADRRRPDCRRRTATTSSTCR